MIFAFYALPVFALKLTGTWNIFVLAGRYECIFLYFFRFTCHEIVSIPEDEGASAAIFMGSKGGCASDKISADEDN